MNAPAPAIIQGSLVEWRPLKTKRGRYEVSSLGDVRSLDCTFSVIRHGKPYQLKRKGRMLRPGLDTAGYRQVCVGGQQRRVSSLIAEVFLGPRPKGMEVCHNDGSRTNDAAVNLRYDTRAGNQADSLKHGTRPLGEQRHLAKLTSAKAIEIRIRWAFGEMQKDLAAEFGVAPNTIKQLIHRRTWKHV